MRFDLLDLRLFRHVCEAGSITGGAARSHLTLQSASERIRGMEDELGVPLLHRRKTGIEPTDAGLSLVRHCRVVLRQIEHMRSELRQYGQGLQGHIRLLCNTSALSEYLPDVLADYLALNPKISLTVEEKPSYEIVHAIRSDAVDIGIVADSVNIDGLEYIPFRDDRLVLIVSANSSLAGKTSVAFEDIVDAAFIGLADGSALQDHIADHAKKLGKKVDYRVKLRSFDAICRMVASGVGVGIVPEHAAVRSMKSLGIRAIDLSDRWAARKLIICAKNIGALPPYLQAFIGFIAAQSDERAC